MGLTAYEAFIQVVEQGSVSAAARVLGVPRPTISRRLARLEERLGERLVRRGARKIVVTRAGLALYDRVRQPLNALAAAEREVLDRSDAPRGLLRVAIPPLLAHPLAPFLVQFQHRYPEVSLEVFTETRFVDLTGEGFDVALRGGVLKTSDLVQRRLATMRVGVYASREYLDSHGVPQTSDDLGSHSVLRSYGRRPSARPTWPLQGGGVLPIHGDFVTNDRILLRAACEAGHGLALLADLPPLGPNLVRVLPEIGTTLGFFVVYPERSLLPPRSRAFVDAAASYFKAGESSGAGFLVPNTAIE